MRSNTNILPLELKVPFQKFVAIYRRANLYNKDKDICSLYTLMQPTFELWENVWNTKNYIANVNISSLVNILKADDSPSGPLLWKIETYNEYLRLNSLTLVDELNYCFIEHLKKEKHIYDRYYEEKNLLFFIAKDIKMFLFKKIRKALANYKKCGDFKIQLPSPTYYYDYTLDLSILDISPLHSNVLSLLMSQNNCTEIKNTLNLSHKQYREIIECLSQNLKQLNK